MRAVAFLLLKKHYNIDCESVNTEALGELTWLTGADAQLAGLRGSCSCLACRVHFDACSCSAC